jgi:hypothetical protein
MFKIFFLILLFVPFLRADEPAQDIKKPARASYREPFRVYQGEKGKTMPKGIGEYYKLTVSPKTFPDPLLRYRLHILPGEYEPGNAYPLTVEALRKLNSVQNRRLQNVLYSNKLRSLGVNADKTEVDKLVGKLQFKAFPLYPYWSKEQYTQITAEEEAALFADLAEVFKLLDKASRKRYYDWSEMFEPRGMATILPHIQEFRGLIRYLQSKADWEIRNGKYEDAVKTIRVGYTLGHLLQNSAPSPFIVILMVGVSTTAVMNGQLQNLMNQPDAPNLYPALTQLHFSRGTFLNSIYVEQQYWLFPRFVHPDIYEKIDKATSEECKNVLYDIFDGVMLAGVIPGEVAAQKSLLSSIFCLGSYPAARQRLLDKGCTEEQIEALSTYQIVVPYILEMIQRTYDLMYVSSSFALNEQHPAIEFDGNKIFEDRSDPVKMFLTMLLPATESAQRSFLSQTQMLDRLKIAEALRYYAAVHDGKLPASLDDIKEIPVPKIDPLSGKPYIYKAEGNTATIDYRIHVPGRMEVQIEK